MILCRNCPNTEQKNSVFEHFSRIGTGKKWVKNLLLVSSRNQSVAAQFTYRILQNIFKSFNSILDCCNPKNDGSNEYKGNYTFPKALAGFNNSQTCKYGGSSSSDAVINCEANMETGPTYGLVNVTLCPAKYQTTNDLEKLDQVELCHFVSEKI